METKLRINQNILKFEAQLVFPLKMARQMSSLRGRGMNREGHRQPTEDHNHRNMRHEPKQKQRAAVTQADTDADADTDMDMDEAKQIQIQIELN